MSLSLACPCGSRFEVEETFAGREVSCPECGRPVRAPARSRGAVRTSDLAIGSVIVALVGAFTVVGTLVAVALGAAALVQISRNRDRVAGTGYAIFGILAGLALTALSLLAYSTGELFGVGDQIRAQAMAGKLEDDKELQLDRPKDGFRITRPSHKWKTARPELMREMDNDNQLLLVSTSLDAFVDVYKDDRARGHTLQSYLDQLLEHYRSEVDTPGKSRRGGGLARMTDFKVREKRALPPEKGVARTEAVVELRIYNQPFVYILRVLEAKDGRFFVLRGWTSRKRFAREEAEIRQVMDSFEVIEEEA
jgi:hypothetical protein